MSEPNTEQGAPAGEGTSAAAAGSPAESGNSTPAVTDAGQGEQETAEQQIARLKKERDDAKALVDSWKPKVEEANEIRRAQNQPQDTTGSGRRGDALDTEIAFLEGQLPQLQADVARYKDDPTTKMSAYSAATRLEELYKKRDERMFENALKAAEPEIEKLPAKYQAKTRELLRTRQYTAVHAAFMAAKGADLPDDFDPEAERNRIAKEREELERDRRAREGGRLSLGGRPVISKADANGIVQVKRGDLPTMRLSKEEQREYNRRLAEGKIDFVD